MIVFLFGSYLVALGCLILAWRSEEPVWFKVLLTLLLLVPVLGPLCYIWVGSWPDRSRVREEVGYGPTAFLHHDLDVRYKRRRNKDSYGGRQHELSQPSEYPQHDNYQYRRAVFFLAVVVFGFSLASLWGLLIVLTLSGMRQSVPDWTTFVVPAVILPVVSAGSALYLKWLRQHWSTSA